MTASLPLQDRPGDYLGGRFVNPSHADGELTVRSPADTSQHVATHAYAGAHVDRAVQAARSAFPAWRRLGEPERARALRAYQERLRARREELVTTIALEVGKPLWEARTEVDAMIAKIDLALGEGATFTARHTLADLPGEIRHRPLGVVAVIGPFNFPGHLPNGQIVPALLLGNCVVHKPSEKTPSTATLIGRCMHEAGVPPGVFNFVQGPAETGAALTRHPGLDGILFTGSAAVGQRIVVDNAQRPERLIALELGGKNAAIALDDCELERAARAIAFSAFATAGQRCTSTSRLIVTHGVAEALVARIAEVARTIRVGHPFDDDVFHGPMISEPALDAVLRAQAAARSGGYDVVLEGGRTEVAGHAGHYLRPAIHRAQSATVEVAGYTDHELFGPDLAVYEVDDLEHALQLCERSRFGLAASVFTQSRDAFERAADALRVGVLHWNRASAGASGRLPFGGLKQSGNHRPAGILMGASCSSPQGVLLDAPGTLPTWPGIQF